MHRYAVDVDSNNLNRRIFVYADKGIPDVSFVSSSPLPVRFFISSLFRSHSLSTIRHAVELSSCAVYFELMRSVRMFFVESLLKLLGALSFKDFVEYSSSILYHFS